MNLAPEYGFIFTGVGVVLTIVAAIAQNYLDAEPIWHIAFLLYGIGIGVSVF